MTLPTGTFTFLFTDIEGSTKLWEAQPDAMHAALARHDELLRDSIERHNGCVFKTVGDAFCAAFPTAPEALNAALEAQCALARIEFGETGPLRVRMALHAGEARQRDNDYFGPTLNRTARLQGVAQGQQTLLSQAAYDLVATQLPEGCRMLDLGIHRLKDLAAPEHVWQLVHPSLPAEFAPLKSLDYLPTNLPQQLTSFIGREKEMNDVRELMNGARLVTLTGSGGTGKTRLAVQAAAELLERYPDGVWLAELAPLADPGFVSQAVAEALGVREVPKEPIAKTLLSALRDKQLLLVMDNCEHLLDSCAHLVDAVLKSCPRVKVLVSSREALGITGETTYRVPSLPMPDATQPQTPDSLSSCESARLFIERAGQANSTFTVTMGNAPALASVCRRLDGIPLAIELAAARARSLSVEEINARLDQRFRLLTGGSRTALPRQQTLRAMIDWSYDLLNEAEKALLNRSSVFAGGWTLESAEAVCGSDGETGRRGYGGSHNSTSALRPTTYDLLPIDVLDLLTSLCDKSLLLAEQADGVTRYRLLETVRQYARDRLMEGEGGELWRERHIAHFLSLAESAEPQLSGPNQQAWLKRLETEHDNLRAALEWSLQSHERETGRRGDRETAPSERPTPNTEYPALRMAGALWRFWEIHGHVFEGREWLTRALELGSGVSGAVRAKALSGAGVLASDQGDLAAARKFHEESLEIRRESGDLLGVASSLSSLGNLARSQGNIVAARALFDESLALIRGLGDSHSGTMPLKTRETVSASKGDCEEVYEFSEMDPTSRQGVLTRNSIAGTLYNLGIVVENLGDYAEARALYEECLAIDREVGNLRGIAWRLYRIGSVSHNQGYHSSAKALYEESLAIMRKLDYQSGIANSLDGLANVSRDQGDNATARAQYGESLAIRRQLGDQSGIAASLNNLGIATRNQDDYSAARPLYEESLKIQRELGHRMGIAGALNNLGDVYYAQGDYAAARPLYEECLAIFRDLSHRKGIAIALRNLGGLAESLGDYSAARALQQESLAIRRELGDRNGIASSLEGFAKLAAAESKLRHAAILWGAGLALRDQIGAPLAPTDLSRHEERVAAARAAFGDDSAFDAAWEYGRAMTLQDAIALALESE